MISFVEVPLRLTATDFSRTCVNGEGRLYTISSCCAAILVPSLPRLDVNGVCQAHFIYLEKLKCILSICKCSAALCMTSPWPQPKMTVAVCTEVMNTHAESSLFMHLKTFSRTNTCPRKWWTGDYLHCLMFSNVPIRGNYKELVKNNNNLCRPYFWIRWNQRECLIRWCTQKKRPSFVKYTHNILKVTGARSRTSPIRKHDVRPKRGQRWFSVTESAA